MNPLTQLLPYAMLAFGAWCLGGRLAAGAVLVLLAGWEFYGRLRSAK